MVLTRRLRSLGFGVPGVAVQLRLLSRSKGKSGKIEEILCLSGGLA